MTFPYVTPGGINPNPGYGLDSTYGRPPGYDPKAALWSQIASALQQAGAGIATAPRGQAIGQGLLGVLQGTQQGQQNYESGLLSKFKFRQLADEQARTAADNAWAAKTFAPATTPAANPVPFNTAFDSAGVTGGPAGDSGSDTTAGGKPPEYADIPDNVWQAAADTAQSGDIPGARKILTDFRLKGPPELPGNVGEWKAAITAGAVPPDTKYADFLRLGKDPTAPIVKDFIEGSQTVQKQWNPDTKAWDQVGAGPRFAPQQAPQPSDFQRKLNEVAKIYQPGTQEYNDAVLNIAGAAKSQGMSITTDPDTGAVTVNWGNKAPTDTQNVASGFYDRAQTADKELSSLLSNGYEPSLKDAAGYSGGTLGNYILSDQGQQFYQAQRNFINAVLRKESGAVIGPSEFENAQKQYFPQPGDSDAVLKQKAENRRQAIESLKRSSGPAASMITPAPSDAAGTAAAPAIGTIDGGYKFKGGDPADPASWEKVP